MAVTNGSVEIIDSTANTSDGIPVSTPDVSALPAALAILRGLTDMVAVTPIPTEAQEIGKFTYRKIGEEEFERQFSVEIVQVPVADAMWTGKKPGGAPVTVYFRKTRVMTPDEVAAAVALAGLQDQRRLAGE